MTETVDTTFTHNSVCIAVSREMLLDHGLVEPTPEEATARHASSVEFYWERRAEWAIYEHARAQLAAITDPLARAILDLHAPEDPETPGECQGCDWRGYEAEAPEWPCRTVTAVADQHGIDLPHGWMIDSGRPDPEPPEPRPWTGPLRIRDLFPSSFVRLDPESL